jgi:hypothetical protein
VEIPSRGWRIDDGGWVENKSRIEDRRWKRIEDGESRMEDRGKERRIEDGGSQIED